MNLSPTAHPYHCFVGVDIAAQTATAVWHVCGGASSAPVTFAQRPDAIQAWIARLLQAGVIPAETLVVMEATSSYWITLATTLHAAGFVVAVVNAAHAHHFAKSCGYRAKTDNLDAAMLCRFAIERQPPAWTPPPQVYHELRQRLMARDLLLDMRQQARNHRHALEQWPVIIPSVIQQLNTTVAALDAQIEAITAEVEQLLADSTWGESARLLQSISGIGCMTTAWLLVGTINFTVSPTASALSAYAGLAPLPRESGTSLRGRPRLGHGGHRRLRTALFLATLSAARYNPTIKVYYDRLRAAGKPSKVARCAAARKLLQLARAVVIHKQVYDPHYHRNPLGHAQPH